jgi:integrase
MASVYARGAKLCIRVKEGGRWVSKPTKFIVGQEAEAQRYANAAQKKIDARAETGAEPEADTVRVYALGAWIEARREAGHDWVHDRGRLVKHVLPVIGAMKLADVRAVHIADLVRRLRFKSEPKLAPRTVRNIYTVVAAMFRDATIGGRVEITPCVLAVAQLGSIVDKDPEWRTGAQFTRAEAEAMIGDARVPFDRQIVYAFGLLAGLRCGEAAALRWRHYDPTATPLGKLLVAMSYSTSRSETKRTKTETTKTIPVHATLAAMLEEWHRVGWAAMMGRTPGPDDLIVPLPPETAARRKSRAGMEPFRGWDYTGRRWREADLPALGGWRHRSVYDTRATFITLAVEDGADDEVLADRVTHTKPKRSAFDGYDRGPHWLETCAEISKLRIERRVTPPVTAAEVLGSSSLRGSGGGYRTPDDGHVDPHGSPVSDDDSQVRRTSCDLSLSLLVTSSCYRRNGGGE